MGFGESGACFGEDMLLPLVMGLIAQMNGETEAKERRMPIPRYHPGCKIPQGSPRFKAKL